jgi:hypothetical protein
MVSHRSFKVAQSSMRLQHKASIFGCVMIIFIPIINFKVMVTESKLIARAEPSFWNAFA